MRFLRKCMCMHLCMYNFYYQQGWQLCLFKVAWHFPLQNLISSCQNWTIWSDIFQVNSLPPIQKFVRTVCIFIWSYQASPFSSFLKVKDTDILLYKQYFSHIKKHSSLARGNAFTVVRESVSSVAGMLAAANRGEYSFIDCMSKYAWDLSEHIRNCNLPCNCIFVCCCYSHLKEHQLVVGCTLASLDWQGSRFYCCQNSRGWHPSYKSLGPASQCVMHLIAPHYACDLHSVI